MEASSKKSATPSTSTARSSQRRYSAHPATQAKGSTSEVLKDSGRLNIRAIGVTATTSWSCAPKFREAPVSERPQFYSSPITLQKLLWSTRHRCVQVGAPVQDLWGQSTIQCCTRPSQRLLKGSAQAQPRSTTEPSSAQPGPSNGREEVRRQR